ncbi:MAG: cupin domain-containing protein [Planctomycetota bacterium]|jgi:uncharacterized cupin superfamily protein
MATIKDVIIRKPSSGEADACQNWPVWSSDVSEFYWEYTQVEHCLVLEGQVQVKSYPDKDDSVTFGPGDYVIFPVGLRCYWSVTEPVKKHYDFE